MSHIIKRKGHKQEFDERKVYASVYAACLAAHVQPEEAENIANSVTREIKEWIKEKEAVASDNLSKQITSELKRLNDEAAFMYKNHRDIS
jgi:transcriptional regulator NrdR family protein